MHGEAKYDGKPVVEQSSPPHVGQEGRKEDRKVPPFKVISSVTYFL
jgi:hypothetical protein